MTKLNTAPIVDRSAIERARALIAEAMATLDQVRAPSDIAAHLDFALHRMAIYTG